MTQRRILGLLGASAGIVVILALAYASAPFAAIDHAAQALARRFVSPALTPAMNALTVLGGTIGSLACVAVIGALMLARRRWRALLGLGVVIIGNRALIYGLKPLVLRDRPTDGVIIETGHSYPSGHAIAGAAVWVYVAWLASTELSPGRARTLTLAAILVMPVLIGLTRLYLGVHWLTDVIGGWAAGTGLACLAILMVMALESRARSTEVDVPAR